MDWSIPFRDALPYPAFLDRYATPAQQARWRRRMGAWASTPANRPC